MAQVIRYVDPDVASPGNGQSWATAYTSLETWEVAEKTDLVSANNYMTVYCRSSSGTHDTANFSIVGWTLSATSYIEIVGADFPSDGIYNDTKYVFDNSTAAYGLQIYSGYVSFRNIQFLVTTDGTNARHMVVPFTTAGQNDIYFDSCIIKGVCSGTGSASAFLLNDADCVLTLYNTVIYGFKSGADSSFGGIIIIDCSSLTINNCTLFNNYYGIQRLSGTVVVNNSAVFNNTDDWSGTIVADYCASDDANATTYTNGQDFTAEATDWNKVFEDYTIGDVRLKDYTSTPCCVARGIDNPGSGLYLDDIRGLTRTSSWDIGAFEYGVRILEVSVSDALTVGTACALRVQYTVNVTDSLIVTDGQSPLLPILEINVNG